MGHVAHVVAHVVGDGGGVAGVVLGDAGLHLAHQVSAHVGGLGVDAAAHTGEQGHKAGAHAVHNHDVAQGGGILNAEAEVEDDEPKRDVQHAQANHSEAHDGAGGESHPQAAVQALRGGLGGPGIGVGGDLHADEARQHRPDAAGDKCEGGELGEHLPVGGKGNDQQDHKDHCKHLGHRGVLMLQVGVGALTDGRSDLLHLFGALGVAQHLLCLYQGKDAGNHRAEETNPNVVLQESHLLTLKNRESEKHDSHMTHLF